MEKIKHFFVAHFATTGDMQAALRRVSDDVRNARGGPEKQTVKIFNERPNNAPRYGAGSWQASTRGGVQGGGYRSGGASDSEGGRGGRGGRGGYSPWRTRRRRARQLTEVASAVVVEEAGVAGDPSEGASG